MSEMQTADANVMRDFMLAVRDRCGVETAKELIETATGGFGNLKEIYERGGEKTWTDLVISCAVILALAGEGKLEFAPPFKAARSWTRGGYSWAQFRHAAALMERFEARARELGCVVMSDEIVCASRQQAAELNRFWTELWDAGDS